MKTKEFDLTAKKAVVFGATGSIGGTASEVLNQYGAEVALVGRDEDKLKHQQSTLPYPEKSTIHSLNAVELEAINTLFKTIGTQDILVNSVGTNQPESILEVQESTYDQIMNINVKSAFFQTQAFIAANPRKIDSKRSSSIIHISSQMAHVGGFDRTLYCTSKHALEGLCKATAIEVGKWNIRINSICPTFIETDLTKTTLADPKKKAFILEQIAMNRLGQLNDLRGAILYLAADCSSLVTGTSLKVDGGWTAK